MTLDWAQQIPDSWQVKSIKTGFRFAKGKNSALYTKEYVSDPENTGEYPVYSGQTESEGILGNIKHYDYDLSKPVIFSTTVGAKAMTPRLLQGKFSLSQNCLLMLPNQSVDAKYFYYQTLVIFNRMKSGIPSHMQPSLRVSDFGKFYAVFPPLEEQGKIAKFLDQKVAKIDSAIAKKKKLLELLEEKRETTITKTITRGMDPKVKTRNSGITWLGSIPSHWETKRLKYVGKTRIGLTFNPTDLVDEGEGVPLLRANNIFNGKVNLSDLIYIKTPLPDKLKTQVNDILICSRSGSRNLIGKNALIPKGAVGYTFGVFMTLFRSRYNKYVYHVLNSNIFKFQTGRFLTSTINQLTQFTLNNFEVPFPPVEEQRQIAEYLDEFLESIESASEKIKNSIQLLEEYKTSLISNAVTGRVRV